MLKYLGTYKLLKITLQYMCELSHYRLFAAVDTCELQHLLWNPLQWQPKQGFRPN